MRRMIRFEVVCVLIDDGVKSYSHLFTSVDPQSDVKIFSIELNS